MLSEDLATIDLFLERISGTDPAIRKLEVFRGERKIGSYGTGGEGLIHFETPIEINDLDGNPLPLGVVHLEM